MVWIENSARAVTMSEASPEEIVPARFLQRRKSTAAGAKANARVSKNLQKDSPTLSSLSDDLGSKQRFRDGEVRDRMQHTGLHYNHHFDEMQRMHPTQRGACEHVSVYESRV